MPRLVVLIRADPLTSHRPAEALRIAAGVVTNGIETAVILSGGALHLLTHDTSECVDDDVIETYLPVLVEWKVPFYVERHELPDGKNTEEIPVTPVDTVTQVMAEADRFLIVQ